ncbi:MAG: DUF6175 family protein, partial [Bacteroidia bacterium]
KNNYHIHCKKFLKIIFDYVRIHLKDQTNGNNYNPNKFALEIFKFLKSIGLEVKKDVKLSTIYITIK